MLISLYAFTQIFGYHPYENKKGQPVSASTDRCMGPDFATLRDAGIDAGKELFEKEHEDMELTSDDGLLLKAYYFRNEMPCGKTVILIHGHNSHALKDNSLKALGYMKAGFNILMPDNRACGRSQGKWETFGAKESSDTLKWIEKLVVIYPNEKIIVDGCSMGGATVCLLSDKRLPQNVKFLVSDCSYARADEEFKFAMHKFAHLPPFPMLNAIGFWNKRINKLSFDDQCPIKSVSNSAVPMIFIHGREDRYIPVENAQQLYDACPADKQLVIINGAGHAAACVKGAEKYFEPIMSFSEKYL